MTLPGPSRRIIVQPLEVPAVPAVPDERDPVAEPGAPDRAPEPAPEPAHEPLPEREPVPVP